MFKASKGKHRKPRVPLVVLVSGFAPMWLAAILLAFSAKSEMEAASTAQLAETANV